MDIAAAVGTLGIAIMIIAIPCAVAAALGYAVYCNVIKRC